jgi:hypothetical protein
MSDRTPSYIDLTNELFSTWIETVSASNQRVIGYWRGVAAIAARPYPSAALDDVLRENAERTTALVDLPASEIEGAGDVVATFTKKFVTLVGHLREQSTAAVRGLYETGLSNIEFVKSAGTSLGKSAT